MSPAVPGGGQRDRYAQCDDTCTADCGACKGLGRPLCSCWPHPQGQWHFLVGYTHQRDCRLHPSYEPPDLDTSPAAPAAGADAATGGQSQMQGVHPGETPRRGPGGRNTGQYPAADAAQELREQIARTVGRAAWGQEPGDLDYVVADALLSGPLAAVLGRLAAAEAHRRADPAKVALAWHDVTCPEAEDCRDRQLHAASSPVASQYLPRFLDRLRALDGEVSE